MFLQPDAAVRAWRRQGLHHQLLDPQALGPGRGGSGSNRRRGNHRRGNRLRAPCRTGFRPRGGVGEIGRARARKSWQTWAPNKGRSGGGVVAEGGGRCGGRDGAGRARHPGRAGGAGAWGLGAGAWGLGARGVAGPRRLHQPQHLGAIQLQAQELVRAQLHHHLARTITQAQAAAGGGPHGERLGFAKQHPHLGPSQGGPISLDRRGVRCCPGPGQAN